MEKDFDELTIADDIAKQCTSMYILGLRVCNANLLLHRTTAVHGGIDTLRIFSSGTDAARIMQKRCFGSVRNSQPKVYKDVHFWLQQRSRCAVYLQKEEFIEKT